MTLRINLISAMAKSCFPSRTARPGQSAARPGVMFPGVTGVHPIAAAVPRPGSSTAHSVLSNTV